MTRAPQSSDESILEATISLCLDCGTEGDSEDTECIECDSDALEYLHVTTEPLGYDDDAEYKIHANANLGITEDRWSYYGQEPT